MGLPLLHFYIGLFLLIVLYMIMGVMAVYSLSRSIFEKNKYKKIISILVTCIGWGIFVIIAPSFIDWVLSVLVVVVTVIGIGLSELIFYIWSKRKKRTK